ncbi:MFS transporter [Streptomyces millisiae]|uniref:MFS transporter n=1 Tax=Streptomyces millisiae TaxID=3075542 RepID=A0ABU2M0E0_9ACTN|nr:MFS transporter [Streptomyces sp. DSM 44918]MDT0323325.1 MFS transporter [Streptomyces sp. DSM 44918]
MRTGTRKRTRKRTRKKSPLTRLSLGHACVDFYQGAVPALVPFLVAERGYGYAAASGIVLAASLLSSVVQPLFGALTDRWPLPWLLPASTLVAGAGLGLAGVGDSYALTLAAVAVSGIGAAAYHPESARVARLASEGSHTAMSWFALGGNVGFAAAPLLVAPVVAVGGLGATPLLALPALVGALLCAAALRLTRAPGGAAERAVAPAGVDDRAAFLRLTLAVVCRSIVFVGLSSFVGLYVAERVGGGEPAAAVALFVLYLGGGVGTVLGGRLAGRWGRVRVVAWSYAATVFAVAGVVLVPGPAVYGFVAAVSAALYVPFSLQVTLAQDYLPNRIGTASGVTLGLTVTVGGVATPLIGAAADATSLRTALLPLIVLPAVAWLLARRLPEPDAGPRVAEKAEVDA